jgi:hypothetical protein
MIFAFFHISGKILFLGSRYTYTYTYTYAFMECYKKLPKSAVRNELGEKSVEKWQRD